MSVDRTYINGPLTQLRVLCPFYYPTEVDLNVIATLSPTLTVMQSVWAMGTIKYDVATLTLHHMLASVIVNEGIS